MTVNRWRCMIVSMIRVHRWITTVVASWLRWYVVVILSAVAMYRASTVLYLYEWCGWLSICWTDRNTFMYILHGYAKRKWHKKKWKTHPIVHVWRSHWITLDVLIHIVTTAVILVLNDRLLRWSVVLGFRRWYRFVRTARLSWSYRRWWLHRLVIARSTIRKTKQKKNTSSLLWERRR